MEVKISKINESVETPSKKNIGDAAYDLHFYSKNHSHIIIEPGECALLDTGLRFHFPSEYVMEIKNRSGMAAKRGLIVGACIVDSSFTGNVFVNLWNISKEHQRIEPNERIAQAIFYKVENILFSEVNNAEYTTLTSHSTRQDGALGSTGKF